jgi:hypothetical protein
MAWKEEFDLYGSSALRLSLGSFFGFYCLDRFLAHFYGSSVPAYVASKLLTAMLYNH